MTYSSSDVTTQALKVTRTQNHMLLFKTSGLKPNTKHNSLLDGVDYDWAIKPFGKDLGEELISDSNGEVIFYMLLEINFMRPKDFEYTSSQSLSNAIDQFNTDRSNVNFIDLYKILEIKSPDSSSYAQFQIKIPMMLVNGADSGPNIHA